MKKLILGISLFSLVILALVFYSNHALANNVSHNDRPENRHEDNNHNGRNFNPDKNLSQSACGSHLGRPVVDVTQKVQNDVDSGFAGNYWAFDYYTKHITVWQTVAPVEAVPATYCATVVYDGNFYAVPGQVGPGNNPVGALINTPMNAPVNGDMSGGRRVTFTGTLLSTPAWPLNGSVGTTNYQCDIISAACPGWKDWIAQYFTYSNYTEVWWGWKYDGGSHGTWVNAIDVLQANSGNIL